MAQLLKIAPWLICGLAFAAPVQDPTRPPPEFLTASASASAQQPLQLQSVLISPHRKIAVISGEQVLVGQKIRGYTLVSLSASQATLLGPQGRIQLNVLPGEAIKRQPLPGEKR